MWLGTYIIHENIKNDKLEGINKLYKPTLCYKKFRLEGTSITNQV